MKNFSSITENLDITTKKYVDDNKVTSVDGLSGGTLTSPLKISGGDQSTASKISLNQSANGQITDSSTSPLFGFMSSTTLTVGDNGYALALRGSGTRPTYKGADLALYSDIATVPTDYIKYTAQTLTDAQKSQARTNIGAGTSNFSGNYNDLSHLPTIPDPVTESIVSGWGFTKNKGTVTSVAVKMNGSEKGRVTSSGTIDLGTVLTSHQDISGLMPKSGGTFTGDVTVASGHHLKTDLIKSADDSKWIAEITPNGLEIGGNGTPLRFYSNTRLVHATVNKELAYISDIPTFSLSGTTLTITI